MTLLTGTEELMDTLSAYGTARATVTGAPLNTDELERSMLIGVPASTLRLE